MEEFWRDLASPEYAYGHLTYILGILAVAMRSMRWLRIFFVASGLVGLYYYGFVMSDKVSTMWEFMFVAVNVVQLALIFILGRRQAVDEHERFFIANVAPLLDEAQRRKLMKIAIWHNHAPGDLLMEEGEERPRLIYLTRGAASIERGGSLIGVCGAGDFLGEMSFLTGKPASATVRVANEARCCVFDAGVLRALLDRNPEILQTLENSFNRNLVGKLERMNEARQSEHPAPASKDSYA